LSESKSGEKGPRIFKNSIGVKKKNYADLKTVEKVYPKSLLKTVIKV
jgi:hypothetical protein